MFEQLADQTTLCVGCPKMCRHVCPVANVEKRETVTPGTKMSVVDLVRRGALPLDESAADTMHACTGCGACSEYCMLGNNVAATLVHARQEAAKRDVSRVARDVRERLARSGNPTGSDLEALFRERVPKRPERGELAFFPGCTALRRLPEHASDAIAALEQARGARIAVIPPTRSAACCGYPLWAAGLKDEFIDNAQRMAAHLSGRGTLVTGDPGCAFTLLRIYPYVGVKLDVKVRHISEVLAEGNVSSTETGTRSLYHDPCHLGRHLGVFEAPRNVLQRADGRPPEEFVWNREKGECCGGGALYARSEPDHARAMAARRVRHEVDELARTGATRVVTSCPNCEVMMRRAGVPVWDLSRAVLGRTDEAPTSEGKGPPGAPRTAG